MARGNIDYDEIQDAVRQGATGTKFQMAGAGSYTAGHALVYDSDGNAIDGGTTPGGGGSSGALVLLHTYTPSGAATVDVTGQFSSTYDDYEFHLVSIVPATNNVTMQLLVSTDGGSTWQSTNYRYVNTEAADDSSTLDVGRSTGDSKLVIVGTRSGAGIGNGTGKSLNYTINLRNPLNSSLYKAFSGYGSYIGQGSNVVIDNRMSGSWQDTTVVDAVQFKASSGNITGTICLYGVAK